MKFRTGDAIKIISGNDRGKQGRILAAFPGERLIMAEGMSMRKKHVRPKAQGKKGELVRVPGRFPASHAMLICSRCGKPTRVGFRQEGVKKVRVCKKCGEET